MPEGARHDSSPAPIFEGRREAREQALLLLYEADIRSIDADAMLAGVVVEPDEYTTDVLAGVEAHQSELDQLLSDRTADWPLHRLAAIDRAVLRLAAWELTQRDDVPTVVILNEAVELAKTYGTDNSGGFVNGVLANLANEVRPGTSFSKPPVISDPVPVDAGSPPAELFDAPPSQTELFEAGSFEAGSFEAAPSETDG